MTQRWLGGYITNNPVEPTSTVAKGVWTLAEQIVHEQAGNWPTTHKSPSDVSGLQFWVKSDTGVTKDGSNNVSAWADQSGNGRNLSEATNQPLWVDATLNGYPIIRFDGTNDKLATADFAVSQPYHFFTVVRHIATPVSTVVPINFDNDTASGVPCRLQILTAPSFRLAGDGLSGAQRTSVTNTWYLVEGLFNGTSSGFWDHLWNRQPAPSTIPLRATISEERLRAYLQTEIATRYDQPPTPAQPIPGTTSFAPGTPGQSLDIDDAV